MPRLPDVGALGARPVPQGRRGFAQQDTTAPGEAMARAGQVIGRDVGAAVEEYQRREDTQAVFEARRKLDDWERATIYDPEKGAIGKTGKDAFDLPNTIPKAYDEFTGKVAEGLTSERQRRAFNELSTARRDQLADWASRHSAQQRQVYGEAQFKADLTSMQDRATRLATTPSDGTPEGIARQAALVASELAIGQQRIVGYMRDKGMPSEAIAVASKDFGSKVHTGVVHSLLSAGDTKGASAYLKANEGAMETADVQRLKAGMQEAVARERAQVFGDEADRAGWTLAQSLEQARTRFTGPEETAAVGEIKTRFAEKEAVRTQAVKEATTGAWSALMAKGSMSAIPPSLMATLRAVAPEEERQMRDWLEAKWRRAKADSEGTGNDYTPERVRAFAGLLRMAADEPATFADADLSKQMPYLTKPHLNHLLTMQGAINKNEARATDVAKLTMSTMKVIDAAVDAAGIKLSGKRSDKQMKEAELFQAQLFDALQGEAAGGKLDSVKAREIGLGLLREGIEQGSGIPGLGWFPTTKRGFQIRAEALPDKTYITKRYDDIPPAVRKEIEAELPKGMYGGVNKAEVERIYQRAVEQGRIK